MRTIIVSYTRKLLIITALCLPFSSSSAKFFSFSDKASDKAKSGEQGKKSGSVSGIKKFLDSLPLSYGVSKSAESGQKKKPGNKQKKDELSPEQMMDQLMQYMQSQKHQGNKLMFMNSMLGILPCIKDMPSIIGQKEAQEIKLPWLIESLDTTKTSFGLWGLHNVIYPVDNRALIEERQKMVRALATDTQLVEQVDILLAKIAQYEPALLSYWQATDSVSTQAKTLYYNIPLPLVKEPLNKYLNKNTIALEGAMWLDMVKASISIAYVLGLHGIIDEFGSWWFSDGGRDLDIWRGIKNGFSGPIRDHNPFLDKSKSRGAISPDSQAGRLANEMRNALKNGGISDERSKVYVPSSKSYQSFKECIFNGTFGDRVKVLYEGYDGDWNINLPFGKSYTWKKRSTTLDGKVTPGKVAGALGAVIPAVGLTLWRDYDLFQNIKSVFNKWRNLFNTTKQLHARVVEVAHMMQAMRALHKELKANAVFASSCIVEHFDKVFKTSGAAARKLKELTTLLGTSTFKNAKTLLYSRGRLLRAHTLLSQLKNELIPALQAVGELDAYNALAHKCTQQNNPWTFVEFIDDASPRFDLEEYRVPMYEPKSVSNSLSFGTDGKPTRLLLTGPNGGGKSVTITLVLAQSMALAQSVGVVPARSLRMTLFNGLRTCVNPKEQMRKNMSTFMAASAGMDALIQFIRSTQPHKKYMILVDEPYRGTVNDETAVRTGTFCRQVLGQPNMITVLATHIMPDLTEQELTQFGLKHIKIEEPQLGVFKRTYQLEPGIGWWFSDKAKRSRYVDWIKTQYTTEQGAATA